MKKITCKCYYFVIPVIVLGIAFLGQYFTNIGMDRYATLRLNDRTPVGSVIGIVWTIIFVLSTVSAILFWKSSHVDKKFGLIASLYIDNAILNVLRSRLFFVQHWVLTSIIEMILLWIVTVLLIFAVYSRSKLASYLLVPYAIWLIMATYFAIQVYILN